MVTSPPDPPTDDLWRSTCESSRSYSIRAVAVLRIVVAGHKAKDLVFVFIGWFTWFVDRWVVMDVKEVGDAAGVVGLS